ncbi:HCC family HlyC/CorC transporter [Arthrobacter sp. Leaf337]|uniref:hemolysin family protein n=1 Tax=Arthrobacter sp. Leaf337 TaxID=1736342 RepID=UPI0006F6E838|nr:hemolysin family protein [Arthrobacter sp. Leaf337]KQR68425.1 HCC family HlyC/CorC transporter [Arthrobacter sp. Leaf337]
MTPLILVGMAVVFLSFAALLTAAESAFNFLPRHDAEEAVLRSDGQALKRILDQPMAHMRSLRFWRIWFEMASAVAVAVLLHSLWDSVWLAGLAATGIMALVGFVIVGVSPRQLGRAHAAAVARSTAPVIRFLCWVLGPIPGWLVALGSVVAPGGRGVDEASFSEEEFRELVDRATESDMIEDNEAELIQSVFDFGDTLVRAVMVPRTDILSIDAGSSLHRAMSLFLRSGYSRIPVIRDNTDQILGIVYLKDVAAALHSLRPGEEPPIVDELAREVRYVPESKQVSDLLRELQKESTHVAIVIDEYGGTAGLVTLEDLIEEIVGEIVDEYDTESAEAVALGDGSYRVSARMGIDDLGELFDVELDDDEVDTVGGLLAKALGRVPIVGSTVEVDGISLRADRLEGRRNRVSHIIAAPVAKGAVPEQTDLEDLLDEAETTQQGVPREQAE